MKVVAYRNSPYEEYKAKLYLSEDNEYRAFALEEEVNRKEEGDAIVLVPHRDYVVLEEKYKKLLNTVNKYGEELISLSKVKS